VHDVVALSMAADSRFLEERDGITVEDLDSHGEHRDLLMLSHWQVFWNSLRSEIVLPLKTSMTIETRDL
jgi:hypothetical protein